MSREREMGASELKKMESERKEEEISSEEPGRLQSMGSQRVGHD